MSDLSPVASETALRIGHSPDPDDAFMWYPLANFTSPDGTHHAPRVDTGGYRFVHVLEDIQSLNERSERGELEITAISIHQYPYIADRYVLTSCGSSMGDGYGPMVVTRGDHRLAEGLQAGVDAAPVAEAWRGARLAIPGRRTSAWLAFQLWLRDCGLGAGDIRAEVVMFDEIPEAVASGRFDAGVLIHEGQLTYGSQGLTLVSDLGRWWTQSRGLPLPLGGNCIRRDLADQLGPEALSTICGVLRRSIDYALANREAAVRFAMNYARDLETDLADRFVGMYVNDWTLDYGERGREAVQRFLTEGALAGLVPAVGKVDFIKPARE